MVHIKKILKNPEIMRVISTLKIRNKMKASWRLEYFEEEELEMEILSRLLSMLKFRRDGNLMKILVKLLKINE